MSCRRARRLLYTTFAADVQASHLVVLAKWRNLLQFLVVHPELHWAPARKVARKK